MHLVISILKFKPNSQGSFSTTFTPSSTSFLILKMCKYFMLIINFNILDKQIGHFRYLNYSKIDYFSFSNFNF